MTEWPQNNKEILRAIEELFESGQWWIYKGEVVREFEQRFAQSHNAEFGISICNGTVALDIALRGLGIGPGDRVVLPAYNFYSLPKSVTNVGATPIFVDVCPENLTIDVDQVQTAVDNGVKAVVAVHISSSVAKLDALREICRAAGVYLIEDCAQATGAGYGDRRVGSWGDVGLFSFGGVKLMTCGQGGMIITSNAELYEKCYAIVNRGLASDLKPNAYGLIGENYQLSELAAATLGPQLDILDALCKTREQRMQFLDRALASIPGVKPFEQFALTTCRAQMRHSFFYQGNQSREAFIEAAVEADIPLRPGYSTVADDPRLFHIYTPEQTYPVAQKAQASVVAIDHPHFLNNLAYWEKTTERLRELLT